MLSLLPASEWLNKGLGGWLMFNGRKAISVLWRFPLLSRGTFLNNVQEHNFHNTSVHQTSKAHPLSSTIHANMRTTTTLHFKCVEKEDVVWMRLVHLRGGVLSASVLSGIKRNEMRDTEKVKREQISSVCGHTHYILDISLLILDALLMSPPWD